MTVCWHITHSCDVVGQKYTREGLVPICLSDVIEMRFFRFFPKFSDFFRNFIEILSKFFRNVSEIFPNLSEIYPEFFAKFFTKTIPIFIRFLSKFFLKSNEGHLSALPLIVTTYAIQILPKFPKKLIQKSSKKITKMTPKKSQKWLQKNH